MPFPRVAASAVSVVTVVVAHLHAQSDWSVLQVWSSIRPAARAAHAIAYDEVRDRVVMFGGWTGYPQVFGDTWEWSPFGWVQAQPAHQPPARFGHGMVHDPIHW